MDRAEFERLRDLPDKTIEGDIEFKKHPSSGPNPIFSDVPVRNSLGIDVVVNGTYKPLIPSVTYNFVVRGVGPICRVCVNGTNHRDAGRTHKHTLQRDTCPRRNLPTAEARPEIDGLNPEQLWQRILTATKTTHQGDLIVPEGADQ